MSLIKKYILIILILTCDIGISQDTDNTFHQTVRGSLVHIIISAETLDGDKVESKQSGVVVTSGGHVLTTYHGLGELLETYDLKNNTIVFCLLYTSPSPRDRG